MKGKGFAVLAVVAAGVTTFFLIVDGRRHKCSPVSLKCTEVTLGGSYVDVTIPALDCPRVGAVMLDGGEIPDTNLSCIVEKCEPPNCPNGRKERQFECAMRPAGVARELCGKKNPDGGLPIDFGDENVMRPGQFDGSGCRRCPCVQISGIPWKG